MTDLLADRVAATPERTALVDAGSGESWTFRDLDARTDAVAAGLAEAGVSSGDRVGVLAPTCPALVSFHHALARLGAVAVVLHTRQPSSALRERMRQAGVETLCYDASLEEHAHAADDVLSTALAIDDLPVEGEPSTAAFDPRSPEETAVVAFTSGTTGDPKGVRLTTANLRESAEASAYRLGVSPGDRWLCCLPMCHMGGLAPIFRTAVYGTTLVVQRRFDARVTPSVIDDHGVTGVSLVPTMLERLLSAEWSPPAHLDTVLLGGAPAREELLDSAAEAGVPVSPTYGTTETASQIATATPAQARDHPGTVGQPLFGTTVRVVDDGTPVQRGATGEIVVDGPTVSPGYLDEDATDEAFDDDGLHTGDLGYRDADGRLWVVGRVDDMIVTGGENVAPASVESTLREHPDIEDAAVVGLPDPEWGEAVASLVVGDVIPTTVETFCRARLADHEVPKTIAIAESLPRTESDTVDREAVRSMLETERR